MSAAYLIVEMRINDHEQYKAYMAAAAPAVKAAGGEYLARGSRHESLEGDWEPHRVVVLRFPSYEAAKSFYDGDVYGDIRKLRAGTTEYFNMVLVDGM